MENLTLKSLLGEATNLKVQNGNVVAGMSGSDQEVILKAVVRGQRRLIDDTEATIEDKEARRREILKDIAVGKIAVNDIPRKLNEYNSLGVELAQLGIMLKVAKDDSANVFSTTEA